MGIFSHLPNGPSGFSYPYSIDQSCRFNSVDSAKLTRTFGQPLDSKKYTVSTWVKNVIGSNHNGIFEAHDASSDWTAFTLMTTGRLLYYDLVATITDYGGVWEPYFRDPSSWYHLLIAIDTTDATPADRMKLYVNGVRITDFLADYGDLPANHINRMNVSGITHRIGYYSDPAHYANYYLSEYNFVDGRALTPDVFGEFQNGIWVPINPAVNPFTLLDVTNSYQSWQNLTWTTFTHALLQITSAGMASGWGQCQITQDVAVLEGEVYKVTYDFTKVTGANFPFVYFPGASDTPRLENGSGKVVYITVTADDPSIHLMFQSGDSGACNYSNFEILSIHKMADNSYGPNGFHLDFSDASHFGKDVSGAGDITSKLTGWTNGPASLGFETQFTTDGLDISTMNNQNLGAYAYTNQDFYVVEGRTYTVTFDMTVSGGGGHGIRVGLQSNPRGSWMSNYFDIVSDDSFSLDMVATDSGIAFIEVQALTDDSIGSLTNLTISESGANNFTDSGLGTYDQSIDTPTNNFCTLNPLIETSIYVPVLSDGNLRATGTANQVKVGAPTMGMLESGKWYWEVYNANSPETNATQLGIINEANTTTLIFGGDGDFYDGTGWDAYGGIWDPGTWIGVYLDLDAGTIGFTRNGVDQGIAMSGIDSSEKWSPRCTFFYAAGAPVFAFNFGASGFLYTPPTGYKALSSENMPTPQILEGNKGMDTVLYTGTGAEKAITDLEFSPDLVWLKNRTNGTGHFLTDTVRGATKTIYSHATNAEDTIAEALKSFDSNGFTLGTNSNINDNGTEHVSWNWKKDPKYGFDIVSYTGNGIARTISHNLGVVPEMMLFKNRDLASSWNVYHKDLAVSSTYSLFLELPNAQETGIDYWNSTDPTASVFSLGVNPYINVNGDDTIAYLFASIEGYSKVFSYTGNGNADGPFIYCGFRPRFVIIKNSSNVASWLMLDTARDTYNIVAANLYPDLSTDENDIDAADILSNGIKIIQTAPIYNSGGNSYIGIAFAEHPFKYSNAR